MIQLSRDYSLPETQDEAIPIKIIGLGGAGSNALDRIVLDGTDKADLIAMNTDVQSLASSVATHKVQLGRTLTRGLGAGGDPDLGYGAAEESADEIARVLDVSRMVFLCAGLGGGTGSGAAPLVARMAKECGSLVVAFVTLPFSFEGKRRAAQAHEALAQLQETADAIVCFENDRLGEIVLPKAGIHQAFALADVTISQSIRSIINLIRRPGLIRIGFDDLLTALRQQNSRCLFGFGESDGDNRAHEALALALKSPLMDRGRMLGDADHVLVQVAGGPDMTLSEVEVVMQELGRHIHEQTQILFGTAVDGKLGRRLSVTLISSLAGAPAAPRAHATANPPVTVQKIVEPEPISETEPVASHEPGAATEADAAEMPIAGEAPLPEVFPFVEPAARPRPKSSSGVEDVTVADAIPSIRSAPRSLHPNSKPERKTAGPKEPAAPHPSEKPVKQETLQFEPINRGRFEKSEPTIIEGQDLDVPTFLRKNVRMK